MKARWNKKKSEAMDLFSKLRTFFIKILLPYTLSGETATAFLPM